MNKTEWTDKIIENMRSAGTYANHFIPVVETLADILAKRDETQKMFEESGAQVVLEYTNRGGQTNLTQHPLVRLVNDLNRDALSYWRDLGLTPAGLKRINDEAIKSKPAESALAAALKKIDEKLG